MVMTFATTGSTPIRGVNAGINDIYLGPDGNLAVATDLLAVMYACQNAARTILGEMIFQTNEGLPNFELIWVGVPNIPQWVVALRQAFENVPGVLEVISIDTATAVNPVTKRNDVLNYVAVILTEFGEGTTNGNLTLSI